jgi:hypothetical protein
MTFALIAALCAVQADPTLSPPTVLSGLHGDKLLGPDLADLDGDGKPDLVGGIYDDRILFLRNVGTAAEPKFEAGRNLQADGKDVHIDHW